jgi:hypothetical protein
VERCQLNKLSLEDPEESFGSITGGNFLNNWRLSAFQGLCSVELMLLLLCAGIP